MEAQTPAPLPTDAQLRTPAHRYWTPELLARWAAEIVIIFLGITLSFLFDEWRKGQNELREERALLLELQRDVVAKSEESRDDSIGLATIALQMRALLPEHRTRPVPLDTAFQLRQVLIGQIWYWETTTPAGDVIRSTGGLKLIADSTLRQRINQFLLHDLLPVGIRYQEIQRLKTLLVNELAESDPLIQNVGRVGLTPLPQTRSFWNRLRLLQLEYQTAAQVQGNLHRRLRQMDAQITTYLASGRFQ